MVNKRKWKHKKALNSLLGELRNIEFDEDAFKIWTEGADEGERNNQLQAYITQKFKLKPHLYYAMLRHLIVDGYVENINTPRITSKGINFINNGGYIFESVLKIVNLIWKVASSIIFVLGAFIGILFAIKDHSNDIKQKEIESLKVRIDSIKKSRIIDTVFIKQSENKHQ